MRAHRAAGDVAHRARPVADRQERVGARRHALQPGGEIVSPVVSRRHSDGKHHVRRNAEQRIVLDRRPVGVEHHRDAAPPRRLADRPHEIGKAVVGEQQRHAGDQPVRDRRCARSRSAGRDRSTIMRSPAASTMMPDTGAVAPATRTTPVVSMPSRAISAISWLLTVSSGIAERARVVRAAAEPRHRDRGVDRAAAADDA